VTPELSASIRQVIVASPLYRTHTFGDGFVSVEGSQFVQSYVVRLPKTIRNGCTRCGHVQPWDIEEPDEGKAYLNSETKPYTAFTAVTFKCRACSLHQRYWLFLTWKTNAQEGSLTKVGQYPALELEPPKVVAAGMDSTDLALYRRALTCRNSNFGIAAVAYMRRIVENRTNFLIELIATRLKEEDPDSPLLSEVDQVKADRRFSEKIEFAANLLPKSVRLGGQNPISQLHSLTSEALHGLTDDESIDVFDRCQLAFEHVIKRLRQDEDEDQSYKEALKKLSEKPEKKAPPEGA
jgi:hypothetical protein